MKKEVKQAYKELCLKHYVKDKNIRDFIDRYTIPLGIQLMTLCLQIPSPSQIILSTYLLGKGYQIGDNCNFNISKISNKCGLCGKEIKENDEIYFTSGYWSKVYAIRHLKCKHKEKENVYEMQKTDCNCNDCKYYERKEVVKQYMGASYNRGWCNKLNKKTTGSTGNCNCVENDKCFKHRKDIEELSPISENCTEITILEKEPTEEELLEILRDAHSKIDLNIITKEDNENFKQLRDRFNSMNDEQINNLIKSLKTGLNAKSLLNSPFRFYISSKRKP